MPSSPKTFADVERLRSLSDEIAFRLNALEGLGMALNQYVIIVRVLLKVSPLLFVNGNG